MQIITKILSAVAMASALAGCGNPVTLGAGSETSGQVVTDESVSNSTKISVSNSTKATLTIPAAGIIAEAVSTPSLDGAVLRELAPSALSTSYKELGIPSRKQDEILTAMGAGGSFKESPELVPVMATIAPFLGWQVDVISGGSSKKEIDTYLAFIEASAEYTNLIFTEIATHVDEKAGRYADPDSARKVVKKEWAAIPAKTKARLWNEAVHRALTRSRSLHTAGSAGVEWATSDGSSFAGGADGLTWIKSGVQWFGKGSLSGRDWKVAVESAYSKSEDEGTSTSEGVSTSVGQKSSSGAQPK